MSSEYADLEYFLAHFKPKLQSDQLTDKQFNRWPAFEFIARELFGKRRQLKIVETGCQRTENDWLGMGHSTELWNWIVAVTGGTATSIDITIENIQFIRNKCPRVKFVHADSIGCLRGMSKLDSELDLLYLDSFDWSPSLHVSSCLHHMGELAAIWDKLPVGCLIAVDDCHTENLGKHVLVRKFFDMIGVPPLVECHVQVWRKPEVWSKA